MKLYEFSLEETTLGVSKLVFKKEGYIAVFRNFAAIKDIYEIIEMLDIEMLDRHVNISKSHTYPLGFQEFSDKGAFDFSAYETSLLRYCSANAENRYNKIEQFYQTWMQKLSELINYNIELSNKKSVGVLPFTVRRIPPYQNHIHLHNENMVPKVHPDFFRFLSTKIDVYDNLSAFVLLQKPTKGGHLKVYHDYIPYKESDKLYSPNLNMLKYTLVDMEVGDLVLFTAGCCYHEVTEVEGDISRITIGSFLGKSLNSSSLVSYS
jgi:hypothetical protein